MLSVLTAITLGCVCAYAMSDMGTDRLEMGSNGLFFQFVFALIGFICAVLLFFAEYTFQIFRKYFQFLRKRLGRVIFYSMYALGV
jgi:hypothetical protein